MVFGGILNMIECTLRHNTARNLGAAMWVAHDRDSQVPGRVTMTACTVQGNKAAPDGTNYIGSPINVEGFFGSTLTVTDSRTRLIGNTQGIELTFPTDGCQAGERISLIRDQNFECELCEAGKTTPSAGFFNCGNNCPLGQGGYFDPSCTNCSAGTFRGDVSQIACAACAKGRYQETTGGTECEGSCPTGTYGNATGFVSASQCPKCAPGRISASGSATCTSCPEGKYKEVAGGYSCTPCPRGTFADIGNLTSVSQCKQCVAGRFASAPGSTMCSLCPEGSYEDGDGRLVVIVSRSPVSLLLFSPRLLDCIALTILSFRQRTHSTQCRPCPNRTFADTKGLSRCKVCQAGSKYDSTMLVSATVNPCANCPAGTYRDHERVATEADNECKLCIAGKVGRQEGSFDLSREKTVCLSSRHF